MSCTNEHNCCGSYEVCCSNIQDENMNETNVDCSFELKASHVEVVDPFHTHPFNVFIGEFKVISLNVEEVRALRRSLHLAETYVDQETRCRPDFKTRSF